MASLIFKTADRAASHAMLDEVRAANPKSRAECREDHNSEEPYEVWDGPETWQQQPPTPAPPPGTPPIDQLAEEVAKKVLAALAKKGG